MQKELYDGRTGKKLAKVAIKQNLLNQVVGQQPPPIEQTGRRRDPQLLCSRQWCSGAFYEDYHQGSILLPNFGLSMSGQETVTIANVSSVASAAFISVTEEVKHMFLEASQAFFGRLSALKTRCLFRGILTMGKSVRWSCFRRLEHFPSIFANFSQP